MALTSHAKSVIMPNQYLCKVFSPKASPCGTSVEKSLRTPLEIPLEPSSKYVQNRYIYDDIKIKTAKEEITNLSYKYLRLQELNFII